MFCIAAVLKGHDFSRADESNTEGGGGFNPRIKSTESMRALAPEEMPDAYIKLINNSLRQLNPKRLRIHQPRPSPCVIVLAPALANVPMRLVEPDRIAVLLIHMKPHCLRTRSPRGTFDPQQQLPSHATPVPLWNNLKGLYICNQPASLPRPLNNAKARHPPILLRNPSCRIGAIHQLSHIPAAESKWRLKADLLNRVKLGEILRSIEAIVHSPTLPHFQPGRNACTKQKAILAMRMAFLHSVEQLRA